MMHLKALMVGLLIPVLELSFAQRTLAQGAGVPSRREVSCSLQFSNGLRSGRCILEITNQMLTATILEEQEDLVEGAAGRMLQQRRRANRPSQNIEVEIPIGNIFSLNYQIWDEVSGGFLIPDSLVNVDYAVIEVGFVSPSTPERPNRTNRLQIGTSVEYGAQLAEQVATATADPIAVLTQAGVISGRTLAEEASTTSAPTSEPYPDTSAQVQQLLDTNACLRCDLRGADLREADLDRANLEGANLEGADLTEAELNRAYLVGANLDKAILIDADLDESKLISASLDAADLTEARLIGANLTSASLQAANLSQAALDAPTLMPNANLKGANLSGASLKGVNLAGANLENANLEGANLRDFLFTYAASAFSTGAGQFSGGEILVGLLVGTDQNKTFRFKTNLNGANLTSANLSQSNLKDATIVGANFSNANLSEADLEDVDLTSGNLCGATLPDGSRSEQGC